MGEARTHLVTQLLDAVGRGEGGAADRLWSLVYDELRGMAAGQMGQEGGPRTLQPTALVHEAYVRLMASGDATFENRRHFFAAAARAMQEIRLDDARRRGRLKRGGGRRAGVLSEEPIALDQDPAEMLAVGEALGKLQAEHADLAEVVRLRYFVGLTADEAAEVLGVVPRTVANRWRLARAWLYEAMKGE